jgi:hypothetical protein
MPSIRESSVESRRLATKVEASQGKWKLSFGNLYNLCHFDLDSIVRYRIVYRYRVLYKEENDDSSQIRVVLSHVNMFLMIWFVHLFASNFYFYFPHLVCVNWFYFEFILVPSLSFHVFFLVGAKKNHLSLYFIIKLAIHSFLYILKHLTNLRKCYRRPPSYWMFVILLFRCPLGLKMERKFLRCWSHSWRGVC